LIEPSYRKPHAERLRVVLAEWVDVFVRDDIADRNNSNNRNSSNSSNNSAEREHLPIVNRDDPNNPIITADGVKYFVTPDAADLFDLLISCYPVPTSVNLSLPDLRLQRVKNSLPKKLAELVVGVKGKGTVLVLK
jgi:hypothetical protein